MAPWSVKRGNTYHLPRGVNELHMETPRAEPGTGWAAIIIIIIVLSYRFYHRLHLCVVVICGVRLIFW